MNPYATDWDHLARQMLGQGHGETTERYPHRLLDRRWARQPIGLLSDRYEVETFQTNTTLRELRHAGVNRSIF